MSPHSIQQIEMWKKIQVLENARECVLQSLVYIKGLVFSSGCYIKIIELQITFWWFYQLQEEITRGVLKKGISFLLGDVDILWNSLF